MLVGSMPHQHQHLYIYEFICLKKERWTKGADENTTETMTVNGLNEIRGFGRNKQQTRTKKKKNMETQTISGNATRPYEQNAHILGVHYQFCMIA